MATDSMTVSGYVSHPTLTTVAKIILVFDHDASSVMQIGTNVAVGIGPGSIFTLTFQPSSSGIPAGLHRLTFHAVDSNGCVSPPVHFSVTLKLVHVRAGWSSDPAFNFNVWGMAGDSRFSMTSGDLGFQTRIQVDGVLSDPAQGDTDLSFNGMILSTYLTQMGESAVFISFKLMNVGNVVKAVNVECDTDLVVDRTTNPLCLGLSAQRGFSVEGLTFGFTVVGRGHPLVRDVSTSWYGATASRASNYWTQRSDVNRFAANPGCTWSWKYPQIAAGQFVTMGLMIRSGHDDAIRPVLNLVNAGVNMTLNLSDSFRISGSISGAFESDLILVIDGDLSGICRICERIESLYSVDIELNGNLRGIGIGIGSHRLSFYATDREYGRVSDEQFVNVIILDAESLIPISWGPATSNFDIFGTNSIGSRISVTSGRGFSTRMRSGTLFPDSSCEFNRSIQVAGVILTTNFTQIGEYAV
jgi:hypothetical protein